MEGFVYFILGALVSIPIAIFAPFVTNRIQQGLGERSSRQARMREAQLLAERTIIERFVADKDEFTHFLLYRVLLITLVTSFTALAPQLVNAVGSGLNSLYEQQVNSSTPGQLASPNNLLVDLSGWLFTASSLLSVISSIIVIQLAVRSIRIYHRVRKHEEFFQTVDAELARLHGQGESATDSS